MLIGRIAAYWSLTEFLCDQTLAVLLGLEPNVARRITPPGTRFTARIEILRSVSGETLEDDQLRREFESLLEALLAASVDRDGVMHSVWFNLGYEDVTRTTYDFRPGDTPITRSTKYKPDSLEKILDRIRKATEALTSFLLNRLDMPSTTPGIVIRTL